MLVSQDFSCGGGVCCGNVVSGLTTAAMLAPVALSAVEAASLVCRRRRSLLWLRRWLWKGLQQSVGNSDTGDCGGIGGRSGGSGRLAMAMVSAAVALAEAFASVVEVAAVGTVAV